MNILGLQGSPRKDGNAHDLLSMFMKESEKYGVVTETITPHSLNIHPCKELLVCEKKGICPIEDDMNKSIYSMIKNADLIVLASPVFFYSVPAQIKALIDRCQMFWARKYKLKLHDPKGKKRQGFLLSCGASGGKKLFLGIELTTKIFFDAISAQYKGALTYRHIENPEQMKSHPTVEKDIQETVKKLCSDHFSKPSILVLSEKGTCTNQITAAFFNFYTEGKYNIINAGFDTQENLSVDTVKVMEEKNLDLIYLVPTPMNQINLNQTFDKIIFIGNKQKNFDIKANQTIFWDIEVSADLSLESLRQLRDKLEKKVLNCINN